jgi:pimeloyl-ACP methyl ester carboxylesterase
MSSTTDATTRTLLVRDGQFAITLLEAGSGDPVVYLHGLEAPEWNPFLSGLAERHRVIAPSLPGSSGGSTGLTQLLDHHALFFLYQEILDALDLNSVRLVGHAFGGWLAAELAAIEPKRVSRLALIAPLGLWDDAHPVTDFFTLLPEELAAASYHDTDHPGAAAVRASGESDEEKKLIMLRRARDSSANARFIWPIPDKGLSTRIQRIAAPTLIIWGASDKIVPPHYAQDFSARIVGSRIAKIAAAGHLPHVEQPDATLAALTPFLA